MMQAIASIGLSNAAVAVILTVAVFAVTRVWRSPPLAHALWLLVLLKFIAPPLVGVGLRLPVSDSPATPPADAATIPPVDALTAMPGDIPSESHQERRSEVPSDKLAIGTAEQPEPSQAFEQFDPWIQPAPPSPSDLPFPAELPSESAASAPIAADPVTLDDSKELRDAPATTARPRSFDQSPDVPVDMAADRPSGKPIFGNAVNFDAVWPYAIGVWLVGSGVWFAVVGVRMRRFGRLLKRTDAAPDSLREEVAGLAAQFGMRTVPDVRLVAAVIPPLAWAMFGRPLLLLPRELVGRLDADQRMTLLAHELAHLRRRDHLTRWLEICVLGLYWWQPVAWFARRQLHRAAEQCCDAWVVRRFPEHARAYAQALLKTVEFLADADAALPLGATGFSQANLLERRFAMILQGRRTDRLSRAVRYGLLLVGLVILPLSIRSLWADDTKPAEPTPAAAAAKPQAAAATTAPPAATPAPEAPAAPEAPQAPVASSPPATAPPAPVPATPPAIDPADVPGVIASEPARDRFADSGKRVRDGGSSDIDQRLSRLEATVETLVRELRSRSIEPHTPVPYPESRGSYAQPPAYGNPSIPNAVRSTTDRYAQRSSIPNAAPAESDRATRKPRTPRDGPNDGPGIEATRQFEPRDPEQVLAPGSVPIQGSLPTDGPGPNPALSSAASAAAPGAAEPQDLLDTAYRQDQQLEASRVFADLQRSFDRLQTKQNASISASKNKETVVAAYKNKEQTLDSMLDVLDAACRARESELEFAQSLYDFANFRSAAVDSARVLAFAKLRSLNAAEDRALLKWREITELSKKGVPGGEADKEAQAREQYFLFRERTEKALATVRQQYESDPRQQIPRDGPPPGSSRQRNESYPRQQ